MGSSGLTPSNLEDSEIHWRIRSEDPIEVMPPPESKMPLSEEERDLIDQWIREGGEYQRHWSFQPLPPPLKYHKPNIPNLQERNDLFIGQGLKDSLLKPSPEADKNHLATPGQL